VKYGIKTFVRKRCGEEEALGRIFTKKIDMMRPPHTAHRFLGKKKTKMVPKQALFSFLVGNGKIYSAAAYSLS